MGKSHGKGSEQCNRASGHLSSDDTHLTGEVHCETPRVAAMVEPNSLYTI